MRFIILIVFSFFLISIQSTLLNRLGILEIKPDLTLIVTYFVGIYNRLMIPYSVDIRNNRNISLYFNDPQVSGMVTGAIMGFLLDMVSGVIIGPNLISKSTIGFLSGKFSQNIFKIDAGINAILILILSIIDGIINYVFLNIFWYAYPIVELFTRIILIQPLYNSILGTVMLMLFKYLYHTFRVKERGLI
ncbi:MAG: rod shape-determining protein MreD [Nitrospirota bacterium]